FRSPLLRRRPRSDRVHTRLGLVSEVARMVGFGPLTLGHLPVSMRLFLACDRGGTLVAAPGLREREGGRLEVLATERLVRPGFVAHRRTPCRRRVTLGVTLGGGLALAGR